MYLMLLPISNTLRMPTCETEIVIACKSKRLSHETIKPPNPPGTSLAPKLK